MAAPFILGEGVKAPARPVPYRWKVGDPVHRPLRVFALDPGASRFDGAVATVPVPWEPVEPGPRGALFAVRDVHEPSGQTFSPVDLDSRRVAIDRGMKPTTTDPCFAQQMTYAVAMSVYERFQLALGRVPEFAPAIRAHSDGRLEIRPHFDEEDNAYYDPDQRALCFGYVKASKQSTGRLQEGAYVYTCLSHDVVVHETAHALLDGMRPLLMLPSNPDVAGFHEGFADLIALLMRFRYKDVVRRALEESSGSLDSSLLTRLALEWGRSGGDGRSALRALMLRKGPPDEPVPARDRYKPSLEHHDMGAVLAVAIFEAMSRVFDRKTKRLRRIAALAPGAHEELVDLLADQASDLAGDFLNIIIRAVDYCPPVDLTLGEFLRALVTADYVTVPEDPYGYREALVLAFRRYGITVPGVGDLSEDSLLWCAPELPLPPIEPLAFANLRHGCEPGWFPEQAEREKQAEALGEFVTAPGRHRCFGIVPPGAAGREKYDPPVIQSVRTLRRLTPDDDLDFHVVAEITQRRRHDGMSFYGGSTVILDEEGSIRFVIGKSVKDPDRLRDTEAFLRDAPRQYRDAFSTDGWNKSAVVKRFHSRATHRRGK